jgi:hypothetical protein
VCMAAEDCGRAIGEPRGHGARKAADGEAVRAPLRRAGGRQAGRQQGVTFRVKIPPLRFLLLFSS